MLKKILIVGIAVSVFYGASAQESKMETDRPSETQNTKLTAKGYIQAEIGFRKEQQNEEDHTYFHPRANLKYGLSNSIELRAELTEESQKFFTTKEFKYGLKPVELGFKAKLLEDKKGLPNTSLVAQFGIPNLASSDHNVPNVFPRVRMLFDNKITDKLRLAYNVGAEWSGESSTPQWVFTLEPQFEIGEKWEVFIEEFSYIQKGQGPQHHFDGGLAYYISNNVKWDAFGGVGLNKEAMHYFISTGLSFRVKP